MRFTIFWIKGLSLFSVVAMTSRVFLHVGSFSWEALSALGWCGIVRRRSLQHKKSKPCRRESKKFHRIVPWNCWWNKPLLNWLVLNPFWGQTFPTAMFLGNKTPIAIIAPTPAHPVPFEKKTSSPYFFTPPHPERPSQVSHINGTLAESSMAVCCALALNSVALSGRFKWATVETTRGSLTFRWKWLFDRDLNDDLMEHNPI